MNRAADGVSMTKSSSVKFFKIEFLKISSGFSVVGSGFAVFDVDTFDVTLEAFGAGFEVVATMTLLFGMGAGG